MKVYITYKESSTGGDAIDPDDRWSSHTDIHYEFQLVQACLVKSDDAWYCEEFDINVEEPPHEVFVVAVRYESGSTFGRSYGNGCIEGVYVNKDEAMKIAKSIEEDTYSPAKKGYCTWKGYFERLESVDCFVMRLRKSPKDPKEPIRID